MKTPTIEECDAYPLLDAAYNPTTAEESSVAAVYSLLDVPELPGQVSRYDSDRHPIQYAQCLERYELEGRIEIFVITVATSEQKTEAYLHISNNFVWVPHREDDDSPDVIYCRGVAGRAT